VYGPAWLKEEQQAKAEHQKDGEVPHFENNPFPYTPGDG